MSKSTSEVTPQEQSAAYKAGKKLVEKHPKVFELDAAKEGVIAKITNTLRRWPADRLELLSNELEHLPDKCLKMALNSQGGTSEGEKEVTTEDVMAVVRELPLKETWRLLAKLILMNDAEKEFCLLNLANPA